MDRAPMCCASCGIAPIDDVKLKDCDNCDLVKYCSDNCQGNHREQHETECTERRAELYDKQLFTQSDISHRGECPLCCLPLPLRPSKSTLTGCCCKVICNGCDYANKKRENEQGLEERCVYCREPLPKSLEQSDKQIMKRIKKNDPVAMTHMGKKHDFKGEYGKAVEYWTKAAELGEMAAHFCLGDVYYKGQGVEKDEKKAIHHLEQAAIGGHPQARRCLGTHEENKGMFERAAKHYIIAANLGHDASLQEVKDLFMRGIVSKEDYETARRGHQAAVDATKSDQREEAEAAELRDRDLFAMPDESYLGECPICWLPLPLDLQKSVLMSCCSNMICNGCAYANRMRELKEGLEQRCAFCREPLITSGEEILKRRMKRVKKNCPLAMREVGKRHYHHGDHETALKYWTKAAELGDASAHFELSVMYRKGEGVEKDIKKEVYHLEEAAIGGHPNARNNLGVYEFDIGNFERAKKHWIIAANLGHEGYSLKGLRQLYADGHASKEDYADALRAYQVAANATKSAEREVAEEAMKKGEVSLTA